MNKKFVYPYGFRWVIISLILVSLCFIFNGLVLIDEIYFFLLYTFVVTGLFLPVKFLLYKRLDESVDHPLLPAVDLEGEPASILRTIFIVIVVLLGIAFPFLILAFMDPLTWFVSLTGFIAGINLPEPILYIYSSIGKKK
ncbi:MAG: hypothetical protein QW667_03545 [Candidatus Bathyarchaeia archaeon]